ncbi:MAG: hypothetical protein GX585_02560 [Clostridiales bacterium]|nr:hypothetical protein [Clostridiales bacterium]
MDEREKREQPAPREEKGYTPNRMGVRVAALIGAAVVVILVLLYTYSVATGGIFAW